MFEMTTYASNSKLLRLSAAGFRSLPDEYEAPRRARGRLSALLACGRSENTPTASLRTPGACLTPVSGKPAHATEPKRDHVLCLHEGKISPPASCRQDENTLTTRVTYRNLTKS